MQITIKFEMFIYENENFSQFCSFQYKKVGIQHVFGYLISPQYVITFIVIIINLRKMFHKKIVQQNNESLFGNNFSFPLVINSVCYYNSLKIPVLHFIKYEISFKEREINY